MARSKVSSRTVAARERELRALVLRRQGKRYDEIGRELGISESSAWKAVQRAYARSLKLADDEANFNRRLDLERLDVALSAIWPRVQGGDLWAIDRLLAILERRAKLLGLDATDGAANDVGAALAALLTRLAGGTPRPDGGSDAGSA